MTTFITGSFNWQLYLSQAVSTDNCHLVCIFNHKDHEEAPRLIHNILNLFLCVLRGKNLIVPKNMS